MIAALSLPPRPAQRVANLLFLVWFLLLSVSAGAAEWKAKLLNQNDPLRPDGPIPLSLEITNPTPRPVEGILQAAVEIDGQVILRHRSNSIALISGTQRISHLLPPFASHRARGPILVHLGLATSDGTVPLGDFLLGVQDFRIPWIVGQVCGESDPHEILFFPTASSSQKTAPLPPNGSVSQDGPYRLQNLWRTTIDVSDQPLALNVYHTLVLHPDALSRLRPRQLEAIAQWVDAGGTLAVIVSHQTDVAPFPKTETLFPFLQRLTRDQKPAPWTETPEAELAKLGEAPVFFYAGCGRVALFRDLSGINAATGDLAKLFLLDFLNPRGEPNHERFFVSLDRRQLINQLLSDTPRPLSVRLVTWAMIAFALVASIGDYLFLGWLRRRKYTWLLFPMLAGGATAGMLAFSNHHMNHLEQRGVLRIVDLGLDGRVLRESRFLVVLPSRTYASQIDGQAMLLRELPLNGPSPSAPKWVSFSGVIRTFDSSGETSRLSSSDGATTTTRIYTSTVSPPAAQGAHPPDELEGSVAGKSALRVQLAQWTPRLFLISSLGGSDDSGIDWERCRRRDLSDLESPFSYPATLGNFSIEYWPHRAFQGAGDESSIAALLEISTSYQEEDKRFATDLTYEPLSYATTTGRETSLLVATRRQGSDIICYRKLVQAQPSAK